jgi:DNA invertase Pin-like site-specific DNA recombinase
MTTPAVPRPLALAYVRVSTEGQAEEGASLAAQEAALRAEAERRGWDVEIVVEAGRSAKTLNRPALTEARRKLREGEAQFLLCVRLDRLSRSVADFAQLVNEARRHGWGLVLQSPNIDLTDPAGEFVVNVLASAAQYERQLISARVREGMHQRKLEGQHMGRRADAAALPAYRRAIHLHGQSMSLRAIVDQLNAEGIPTPRGGRWHASTVRAMLVSETAKSLAV